MTDKAAVKSPSKTKTFFKWVGIAFGAFVVLIIVLAINADPKDVEASRVARAAKADEKAASESGETAAKELKVTAGELSRAYEANEVKAQTRYGDQALAVTGRITNIELDFMDRPTLSFDGSSNPYLPTRAQLAKGEAAKVAELSKGDRVTVHCANVSEVVGMPMLGDCTL